MRQRILDVAATLFEDGGYNATSMKDILHEAGVSAGAMYHHFPTKKACGLAVIRERVAPKVRKAWVEPLARSSSVKAGLRSVFAEIAKGLELDGRIGGCPLNNLALELSLADPEYRIEIRRIFDEWHDLIAQKLRADISSKKLKDLDPDSFATTVVATFSGAMTIAKAEQSTRALKVCSRQLSATIVRAEVR